MRNIKDRKKNQKTLFSIVGVMFIAACVFLAIECATSGSEMSMLVDIKERLEKENKYLTAKLVDLSSLNVVEKQASSFGFQKPQKIVYIQESEEFAGLLP